EHAAGDFCERNNLCYPRSGSPDERVHSRGPNSHVPNQGSLGPGRRNFEMSAGLSGTERARERRGSVRPGSAGPRRHAAGLLAALVALLVVAPFVEVMPNGDLIEALLLTAVMVTGARAIGGRRRDLVIALLLVTPALASKWINYFRPDPKVFLPL